MKSELKTIEREVKTTVKEDVVVLTLNKQEIAVIQDALFMASCSTTASRKAVKRGLNLLEAINPGNSWWYQDNANNRDFSEAFNG